MSRPAPRAHPGSCTVGTGSFPGVKSGRGVTLTPHPLLVPWSRKSRAIPLLPLWVVRPVQSLSAYTRVHFTLPYAPLYHTVMRCDTTLNLSNLVVTLYASWSDIKIWYIVCSAYVLCMDLRTNSDYFPIQH